MYRIISEHNVVVDDGATKSPANAAVANDSASFADELRSQFKAFASAFESEFDSFKSDIRNYVQEMEKRVCDTMSSLEREFNSRVKKVEEDILSCLAVTKQLETTFKNNVSELQTHNDILQRRLNRADIVINGLPDGIRDLRQPITKIFAFCNVTVSSADIQHICYMSKGKSVLVKLNSVYLRDTIMANYHKSNQILLNDIVGGDVNSRVYLNDHLTQTSSKLLYLCLSVTLANGMLDELDMNQCAHLLDVSCGNVSTSEPSSAAIST
ncbi:uncharacterized protein LOC133325636 [Musca vetustissima]|uniref:uncharacterized protein LOC133325636 n=1 Tax=Musca vetustissima TaxID=27455 RepID=UPI002AB6C007|nr:uncharacterized protein LOC133325636 [Musca vetustissima]